MSHSPDAELAALTAAPRRITLADGRSVAVGLLKVRQIAPFVRAITPVLADVRLEGGMLDLAPLLAEHTGHMAEALGVLVDQPAEWAAELDIDDFTRLTAAAVEVNADFFVRRLLPLIERAAQAIQAMTAPSNPAGSPLPPA
jgi:hypothetical protein